MRSPATPTKVNRADRKNVALASSRQVDGYHTREALLKRFPAAHNLSVYDGQVRLGFIVDLRSGKRSYAYGQDGHSIGAFCNRKAAMAAVGGAS